MLSTAIDLDSAEASFELALEVGEYFELDRESPYMLLVAPVREEKPRG